MANVFVTVNNKILLTAPGSGKIANECCCEETGCTPCKKKFVLFVQITDGTDVAKCFLDFRDSPFCDTDCRCWKVNRGWGYCDINRRIFMYTKSSQRPGTLDAELHFTRNAVVGKFTLSLPSWNNTPPWCFPWTGTTAWVKGVLTEVPGGCGIAFSATIPRVGLPPLTLTAVETLDNVVTLANGITTYPVGDTSCPMCGPLKSVGPPCDLYDLILTISGTPYSELNKAWRLPGYYPGCAPFPAGAYWEKWWYPPDVPSGYFLNIYIVAGSACGSQDLVNWSIWVEYRDNYGYDPRHITNSDPRFMWCSTDDPPVFMGSGIFTGGQCDFSYGADGGAGSWVLTCSPHV